MLGLSKLRLFIDIFWLEEIEKQTESDIVIWRKFSEMFWVSKGAAGVDLT